MVIKVRDDETEDMSIRKAVRQGCLSPTLFNICAENWTEKDLEKARGIIVGGERIKTIKYEDGQAVIDRVKTEASIYDGERE